MVRRFCALLGYGLCIIALCSLAIFEMWKTGLSPWPATPRPFLIFGSIGAVSAITGSMLLLINERPTRLTLLLSFGMIPIYIWMTIRVCASLLSPL